ncbi:hypothetical protein DBV39_14645 [Orrella marina]|uniref:Uncharacterized protein n=2 Tax=Orrella marina TaxID=2163011 RepID=A0A2R4XLU0_9BURK|nr:hypothetical protein DBV39_14645 [Orrella marina]
MCSAAQRNGANFSTQSILGYAIASDEPSPVLPDVPTIGEMGYPGINASTWNMVFTPANTSMPIVNKLNQAINEVLQEPETIERLKSLAINLSTESTVDESSAFLESEIQRWADIARTTGIKPNS